MGITLKYADDNGFKTVLADGSTHNKARKIFECFTAAEKDNLDNSEACIAKWGEITNTSECLVINTGDIYKFNEDNNQWYKLGGE